MGESGYLAAIQETRKPIFKNVEPMNFFNAFVRSDFKLEMDPECDLNSCVVKAIVQSVGDYIFETTYDMLLEEKRRTHELGGWKTVAIRFGKQHGLKFPLDVPLFAIPF